MYGVIKSILIRLLFIILYSCAEVIFADEAIVADDVETRGLLVIPGLGRSDRLRTVVWNLRMLEEHYFHGSGIKWSCIVYIYAPREDVTFWSNADELMYLERSCDIVEVANKRVTENMYMFQPALIKHSVHVIFLLLDDCRIVDTHTFDLNRMLKVMVANNLTVASPLVSLSNQQFSH